MGDWEDLAQSVVLGLIFSFLFAKLISMVISFRGENLRLAREEHIPSMSVEAESESESSFAVKEAGLVSGKPSAPAEEKLRASEENQDITEEQSDGDLEEDDDDDDDWVGVETTELDETFSAATAFVAAAAADRLSQKVSNDVQLQLYGLYKIATEGPCTTPQPSALKMTARAKWNAWQRLGAMPPEEAMQKYIMIIMELYPSWAAGSSIKRKDGGNAAHSSDTRGPMGPVFSTFVYEEESGNELKMEAIHACAREGDVDSLLKDMASGVSVDLKDSEGQSPLHWAVDRGHLNIVELLVSRNADVNAKDNEGQTPLHYAAVCGREAIAEYLVKHDARIDVKDNDGCTPSDLCESNWSWMSCSSSAKPIG